MRHGYRRWLSAGAFGLALVGVVVLWARTSPQRDGLPALVDAPRHRVGPLDAGRLAAVLVGPGDEVDAGQIVARLDTADLDAELDVARATVDEDLAEVEATAAAFAAEARDKRMAFAAELARARATLADVRGQQAARQAELATLSSQFDRLDGALKDRLVEVDRLGALRARQQGLAQEANVAPQAVRAWSDVTQQIRDALDSIHDSDLAKRLGPLRARVETQERRVRQILDRREQRVLRAPVGGRVATVLRAAGDTVAAGEPILEIVPRDGLIITAYVPEDHARGLPVGTTIEAVLRDRTAAHGAEGVVERLGPAIVELPRQLWYAPDRPRYGRPVLIRVTGDADLLPGEVASVRPLTGGAQAATAPTSGPTEVVVPDALKARTRLEPSGAVWVPELQRMLVVSDDTGLPGQDDHVPIVFTATADGHFDPDPLPIEGVDRVSDLESVSRANDGTFYLLASQSLSEKGRRPEKRQWLLRATLADRRLRVTGKIALYDALERGLSAEARADLGLGPALDIEGSAWRDGDLLLGLKAPLRDGARAVVWRLADVNGFIDRGGLPTDRPDAGVTRVLDVALPTCPGGAPGGISELRVEGKRLYLLSTQPDGPACGSAWRLDLDAAGRSPERLGVWPDLKPEGLTRADDGGLVVLFDTGGHTPRITRLQEP
jgi:HlyD family secretion protein